MPVYEDTPSHWSYARWLRINHSRRQRSDHSRQDRGPPIRPIREVPYRCCDVWDAEERGALKPGMSIVEATSGNTGIALAYAARRAVTAACSPCRIHDHGATQGRGGIGGEAHIDSGRQGMKGAMAKAEELATSDPKKYLWVRQFDNRPIREFTRKPRGLKFGTTPKARWTSSSAVSAPVAPDGRIPIHQKTRGRPITTWPWSRPTRRSFHRRAPAKR